MSGGCASEIERKFRAGASIVHVAIAHGVSKSALARVARENAGSLELYEGVLQTLDSLQERGTSIGIVSNLPGWLAKPLLTAKNVDQYFAATVTPRRGVPAKPRPHGIRKVLQEMGRDADAQTWFVGDGVADAEAAEAAGVKFA